MKRAFRDGQIASVLFEVENRSGAPAARVFVDCTFLDKQGSPVEIGRALVTNVPAGGKVVEKASIAPRSGPKPETAECRVSQIAR